jgi:hypothetical protein
VGVAQVAPPEDAARAALESYLSSLPAGLASYPQCQVKGSVLRGFADSSPVPFPLALLPPPLLALLDAPPLPSDWISEVHFLALATAHESQLTPSAREQWVYQRNRRLLRTPLYLILFRVAGPARVFAGVANRWRAFRRGTDVTMLEQSDGHAVLEIHHPKNLYPEGALLNLCCAFRAVLDVAGADSSVVRILSHGPTSARVEARW